MKFKTAVLASVLTAVMMPGAWAHRYIENDGSHGTVGKALPIGDIGLSRVVYHEASEGARQIWLSFEAGAGGEASIQIGVPLIGRYAAFRPAFALLGPGLPPLDAPPVEVPEGCGGIVFTTDAVTDPGIFEEKFTGTDSWVFERQVISLPETGSYYIVGFVPSGASGKFWIAPGTRENFGLADIATLPVVIFKVRTFHEVFFWGGILGWGFLAAVLVLLAPVLLFFSCF